MTTLSTKLCPCCKNPLAYEYNVGSGYIAWCFVGRCPSELGDKGALGDTPEQAADSLIATMNKEMDWITE